VILRPTAKARTGSRRGRPPKFTSPSRIVKLRLPEDVVAALQAVDADLGRAVARVAQPFIGQVRQPAAELRNFGDRAVIVVAPSRRLKDRAGVEFVPLSDGRALICFQEGLAISEIELRVRDSLADPALDTDRETFEALAEILRSGRCANGVSLQRRTIIVVRSKVTGSDPDAAKAPADGSSALRA
jgi:hypothetical protein